MGELDRLGYTQAITLVTRTAQAHMHIQRSRSRLSFRKRRRRSGGCVSILFSILVLSGVGVVSWLWVNRIVNGPSTSGTNANLMASAQNAFDRGDLTGEICISRFIFIL